MKNTKIIRLFQTFDESQLKRLKDFIYSPYFNKNKKIQQLVELIYNSRPEYNLSRELLFLGIFPDETYIDSKINRLLSKLYKLMIKFLSQEKEIEEDLKDDINLIKHLNQHALVDDFNIHLNQLDLFIIDNQLFNNKE